LKKSLIYKEIKYYNFVILFLIFSTKNIYLIFYDNYGESMKKIINTLILFVGGIVFGYYICFTNSFKNIFSTSYKAFQVGVYTNLEAANTFSSKYKDAIIIKDNELYRIYLSILKENNNIENMKKYLNDNGIEYYLKDIEILDQELKKEISDYENIMKNQNEIVFLEINKMIIKKYKESL